MIFDKLYCLQWENIGFEKELVVLRDKGSHFLYIPRLALATGRWEPFTSLKGDVTIIAEGVGEPTIRKEINIIWKLNPNGELERFGSDEYKQALKRIEEGTEEGKELEYLTILINAYDENEEGA